MKIGRILHQQVVQLRWHFLACLGLIMVLPLEEAAVNFKDGAGFYSIGASVVLLWMAPLLAGLIDCATVQADLEDRRYLFWRSKPVRAWLFILLKFFTGLGVSFVILVVPILFIWISTTICTKDKTLRLGDLSAVLFLCLLYLPILIMTYSLCFFSNVLVRKTARAWLIGMAAAGFVLLVPFVLPIDLRMTVRGEYPILIFMFPAVAAAASLAAFVLSLWAVRHDRRLQTSQKGLLWAAAGLLFALMMFFGRQIANIRVLDEKKTVDPYVNTLSPIENKTLLGFHYEIETNHNRINLKDYHTKPYLEAHDQWMTMPAEQKLAESLKLKLEYPTSSWPSCYHPIGDNTLAFGIFAAVLEKRDPNKSYTDHYYKNLYLRSFQFQAGTFLPVSTVELSDLLVEEERPLIGMRIIDNKLILLVNRSCVVAEVSDGGELVILQTHRDYMRSDRRVEPDRRREFSIPLVPAGQISIEEQIKLSIDWNHWRYGYFGDTGGLFSHTITDIRNGVIRFHALSEVDHKQYDLARYEVMRWDDQSIYCRFVDSRPFAFLEQWFTPIYDHRSSFVQNGKFYFYTYQKLMVFDIRGKQIRKLGHFERVSHSFDIQSVAVLKDGSLLLSARQWKPAQDKSARNIFEYVGHLYLLENPE
jgi:hypothetical protein